MVCSLTVHDSHEVKVCSSMEHFEYKIQFLMSPIVSSSDGGDKVRMLR